MLIPPTTFPAVVLPALSVAAPLVTLWFVPLVLMTASLGQLPIPEPAVPSARFGSVHVKCTVTRPLYHGTELMVAAGLVVIAPWTAGPFRSILMPLTEAAADALPALSASVTGPAPRLLPSPVIKLSAGWVAASIPDRPSCPVQWIVTSSLYQPAALAGVVGAPPSVGFVLSMLKPLTVRLALLPALSVAVPTALWLAPSVL